MELNLKEVFEKILKEIEDQIKEKEAEVKTQKNKIQELYKEIMLLKQEHRKKLRAKNMALAIAVPPKKAVRKKRSKETISIIKEFENEENLIKSSRKEKSKLGPEPEPYNFSEPEKTEPEPDKEYNDFVNKNDSEK